MVKYFEYADPTMAAHVEKIEAQAKDAEENETIVRHDPTIIYANNNRDKPFATMTSDDMIGRMNRGDGSGRDHFVVAKHRQEQKEFVDRYETMEDERDAGGNFTISENQTAKVAQVVKDELEKKTKTMSYFDRIKAAVSLSKKAKMEREEKKNLNNIIEKAINIVKSD